MDKEGMMMIILFVIGMSIITIYGVHGGNQKDSACQELGFEEFQYSGIQLCEDSNGNLHYIKMECKPWYWVDCDAKTISVGDVRVNEV